MRIVLLGSTRISLACLDTLRKLGLPIGGLVTTPSSIPISYASSPIHLVQHCDLGRATAGAGYPILSVSGKLNKHADAIRELRPDLLLAVGWYYTVPRTLREIAPLGAIGIHASLLPRFRGGAPVNWAIIEGETETGVSLFYLDDLVDAGDIIGQASFAIEFEDTCATVYDKVIRESCRLLEIHLPLIASGAAARVRQDESLATHYPQRRPEDGLIQWSWPARRIYDFVRAQTRPYPGAFTYSGSDKIFVWKSIPLDNIPSGKPGTLLRRDACGELDVATGSGVLRLLDFEGLAASDFNVGSMLHSL